MVGYFKQKRILIPILTIILLIISLVFIDLKWWYPQGIINLINFGIILLIIILFELFAIIFIDFFQKDSIEKMRNHLVIDAIIKKKNKVIFFHFPLIIIFEEFLFRLLIFTILYNLFGYYLGSLINTLIFGIYHIHIWFEFKDKKITFSLIMISISLGLILCACLVIFGILVCVVIHYLLVLILLYYMKTRIVKMNK